MAIRKLLTFQESQQVPKLKINLGPKKPVEHAFFAVRIKIDKFEFQCSSFVLVVKREIN